jgi:hypothetical protein
MADADWSWEPSAGKGPTIKLDGPRVATAAAPGQSVRARAPLPASGRVYWEVVFAYPGKEKGASLTGSFLSGVVDGAVTEEEYGKRSGILFSKKWWGLKDEGYIYKGAAGHTGTIEDMHRSAAGVAFGAGERIGCLADLNARTLRFYREGEALEGLVVELPAEALGTVLYPVVTPYFGRSMVTLSTHSDMIVALLEAGDGAGAAAAVGMCGRIPADLILGPHKVNMLREALLHCEEARSAAAAERAQRAQQEQLEQEQELAEAQAVVRGEGELVQRAQALAAGRDARTKAIADLEQQLRQVRAQLEQQQGGLAQLMADAEKAQAEVEAAAGRVDEVAAAALEALVRRERADACGAEATALLEAVSAAVQRAHEIAAVHTAAGLLHVTDEAHSAAQLPGVMAAHPAALCVQAAVISVIAELARAAAPAAAAELVAAGAVAQIDEAERRFGCLLAGDAEPAAAREALLNRASEAMQAQLGELEERRPVARAAEEVQALHDRMCETEAAVAAAAQDAAAAAPAAGGGGAGGGVAGAGGRQSVVPASGLSGAPERLLLQRQRARDAVHGALLALLEVLRLRWTVVEHAPPSMGEAMAAVRQAERARLQRHEALLELSGRKQRDDERRRAAQQELRALQKRRGGLELEGKKLEVALLVMEASSSGSKLDANEGVQQCEGCEACPAAVHCSTCGASLCAKCDGDEHQTKLQRRHMRVPIGHGGGSGDGGAAEGGGAGCGARTLDEVHAELRRAARAIDRCKRAVAALAHPHFPELSTSALGRLVDCELLVERELHHDYEIVGEPLSEGQGKNTVHKARLLGTDAAGGGGAGSAAGGGGDGGLCVLKQVRVVALRADSADSLFRGTTRQTRVGVQLGVLVCSLISRH